MLDPEYYRNCADEVIELYSKLELRITRDVVRRIMKTGLITDTAKQQVEVALQSGELYDDIIQEVSAISGESEEIIREIFEDAGIETSKEDFVRVGLNPEGVEMSPAMEQVLKAGITKTNGLVNNLTMTTARTTQTAYIEACSLAELEITSGAFDYNTAIRHAVDSAAESGLKVEYPSGHTDLLDVAIRRAVMTGVTQTTSQVSLANCDTIGTDLVEVSAHGGARPEHAEWQGKIFCINGSRGRYKDFYKETGYGTGPGLCGWNCRHSFYPFLEGVSTPTYTKKEIQRLNEQTVEYEGEQIPQYEAEQKQRAMERQIRKDRRELVAYDEALKQAPENSSLKTAIKSDFDASSYKLKKHEAKYRDFSKQTGLLTQNERLQTKGFNRSVSQKAVAGAKRIQKSIDNSGTDDIIRIREMFRKKKTVRNIRPISQKRFDELTIPARKKGATILRGGAKIESHLDEQHAHASSIGNILLFRQDVTVSEVLEETYHFDQTFNKVNFDKPEPLRTYLNEIEAQKYLLANAKKYQIPRSETEETRINLKNYEEKLKKYLEGNEIE